ncbi:hypothetical protein ACCO45_005422 [Purpureocillium lilacinum]|uniref:Uncharacterized protein n=1 Tax=Purpureocillium lilacinum TaxID=33203 RepID=A0ACC4DY80_PURLI
MESLAPISLKLPSKYASGKLSTSDSTPSEPSVEWLTGTWTVTHSTLSMWRSARNVRISYKPLPPKADGRPRIDDLVEYEPTDKTAVRKTVQGVDTQAAAAGGTGETGAGGWDWRGKGWLFFVGSHWEVLGWGRRRPPRARGVDVYCDRREGLSEATYKRVEEALRKLEAPPVVSMVDKDMRPVEIKLPWTEK